jgi:hypothetical protein
MRGFLVAASQLYWLGLGDCFAWLAEQTLLLEGADSLGADFQLDLLAIYDDGLGLQVRLPDLFGVALGKADIAAVLLAFTGEFTYLH